MPSCLLDEFRSTYAADDGPVIHMRPTLTALYSARILTEYLSRHCRCKCLTTSSASLYAYRFAMLPAPECSLGGAMHALLGAIDSRGAWAFEFIATLLA